MNASPSLCTVAAALWDDLVASSHLDDPARPVLRLEEDSDAYRLRAESPALRAEDVLVEASRRQLRVEGTLRASPPPWVPLAPLRREQRADFARVFHLDAPVDPARSQVHIEHGRVEIRLAKA